MASVRAAGTSPLPRKAAIAIAAGRVGLGVAICGFTRPALRSLGIGDGGGAVTLARIAGIRDIALGVHGLAVRNDRERLAQVTLITTAVDAGDGVAFAAGLGSGQLDRTALVNLPLIGVAVLAGAWAGAGLRG